MREIVSPLDGIRSPFGFIRGGGVVPFSPSTLFASGEEGAWYEPSTTTCFTDTGGTTAASVGDAVARINDLSGNGNHATQGTAAARPLLQQTAGGLYYLAFDGADDFVSNTTIGMTATSQTTVMALAPETGNATNARGFTQWDQAGGTFDFNTTNNYIPVQFVSSSIGSFNNGSLRASTSFSLNNSYVFTSTHDGSTLTNRLDGSQIGTYSSAGFVSNIESIAIGDRLPSGTDNFSGRVYGLVTINRALTAQEISDTEAYLAARSGVVL